jgi:hypothetical protein
MKKLLALLLVCSACSALGQAPTYSPVTIPFSATYPASVNTNLASPFVLFCGKQHDLAIQITFAHSAASISNVVFHFTASVDNVTYIPAEAFSMTALATGATPLTISTNWNSRGYGYLRLDGITNSTGILPLTNMSGVYGIKMSAP